MPPSADAHLALFRALAGDAPADDLVSDPSDRQRFEAQLGALRARPDIEIVSLAVNGPRVDVLARDGDLEWRVVFGTSDAEHVDWLSVFLRPPVYTGVAGGRAVIVNGPSSSGKSSVLNELRSRSSVPWIVFDEPMFGAVGIEYLIWRDRAEVLHRGFLDGIAALARAGNCVGVAAGGHPQATFDAAFEGIPTLRVGLDCDPAELVRRERGRQDVPGGLAESSLDVHDGWQYHRRFDTTTIDAGVIAEETLRAISLSAPDDLDDTHT
jgi:chloramphenicol 3-O phosphotransferase